MIDKPFSEDYVIGITVRNMKRSIDKSIRKTFERIEDVKESEKSQELFSTLSKLHAMKRQLDELSNKIKGI
jgi:hypothetical protein